MEPLCYVKACIFARHPVKQKLFLSTGPDPTWSRTMDASFPNNSIFGPSVIMKRIVKSDKLSGQYASSSLLTTLCVTFIDISEEKSQTDISQ